MTRLPFRSHAEQRVLLAACTTRTAAAPHLSRRRDRDRPVGFADVAAIPDPEWSRSGHNVSRFSVAGLIPAGQLATMPLPTRVLDDIDTVTADVAAAFAARPELLHQHAVLMALAPVLAQLKSLAAVAADELPGWIRENVERPRAGFRAAIHRTATGAHLTSIQPNVCYDERTWETSSLCHVCDESEACRRDFSCWAPASSLTVLTVVGPKGLVA